MKKTIKGKDKCIEHKEFEWKFTNMGNGKFRKLNEKFVNCVDFNEFPKYYAVKTKCPQCGSMRVTTYLKNEVEIVKEH